MTNALGGGDVMSLAVAPIGMPMTVLKLDCPEETRRHLANLGITVGSTLTGLSSAGGDVVIRVLGTRLALNRALATNI